MRRRLPLAAAAGLTLAAAFPNLGIAGLGWIAPGLIVGAALGRPGKDTLRLGYAAGLAHYLTSLYWLLLIPYRWHGIPLAPATGWLALSGFMALFPAGWVWLLCRTAAFAAQEHSGPDWQPGADDWPLPRFVQLPSTWFGRTAWALGGAASWVAVEMVLTRLFGGFPWNLLGSSQYQMAPIIQLASVTGVYGISFLMVWFSLSGVAALLSIARPAVSRSAWVGEIFLPTLIIAASFNLGFRSLLHTPERARTLRVTLVQPSIPQTLIWDSDKDAERFRDLLELTETSLTNKTDLIVWPEAAIPGLVLYEEATATAICDLARKHRVWMVIGGDDFQRHANAAKPGDGDYYNSSFLITPEGRLAATYRKRKLVIFGEYLPLSNWLPFLKWFTPIQSGFTPGTKAVPFPLRDLRVVTSSLICYEDMFPQLARESGPEPPDFLVNLTNDGWFGESAEQWQHAAGALFRAVENGIPLIRCANNGITCWIDAKGRMQDVLQTSAGDVYRPGFVTLGIPLPPPGVAAPPTFYRRHGDLFGWACVACSAAWLLRILSPGGNASRRSRGPSPT